jgi:hypothetical protein
MDVQFPVIRPFLVSRFYLDLPVLLSSNVYGRQQPGGLKMGPAASGRIRSQELLPQGRLRKKEGRQTKLPAPGRGEAEVVPGRCGGGNHTYR